MRRRAATLLLSSVVTREDVSFSNGGERIAAWFYRGAGTAGARSPCVVLGHGLAGVKEARLDAFAKRFAREGLACLVFDYRNFGGSGGQPRQLVEVGRQQADWRAAIAFARQTDLVDAKRIALWGTSFGGGHVLQLAAGDPSIRAVVLHMPLVDGIAAGASEGVLHTAKLLLAATRDVAGALLRQRPRMIPVVAKPGSLALMATLEAEPGYFSIVRDAPEWRNEVPARTVFQLALFRPGRRSRDLHCPSLFVLGRSDTITPPDATRRVARRAPHGQVLELAGGHFDAYLGDAFAEAVAVETAFLVRHLGHPAWSGAAGSSDSRSTLVGRTRISSP